MRFFPGRNASSGTTACQTFSRPGAWIVRVVAQTVPLTAIARSKGKTWSPSGRDAADEKQGKLGAVRPDVVVEFGADQFRAGRATAGPPQAAPAGGRSIRAWGRGGRAPAASRRRD